MYRRGNKQSGAVLVISLLLILVLSIFAVTAMESSQFSMKMAANRIYYETAFNHAESTRNAGLSIMPEYLTQTNWDSISIPENLMVDKSSESLFTEKTVDEAAIYSGEIQSDFSFHSEKVKGEMYVIAGPTQLNLGAALSQSQGYQNTGSGLGSKGGMVKYYRLNSVGISPLKGGGSLEVWTSSDYRYTP